MNDFEKALLASVEEYSKGYLQAVKDLRSLVLGANSIVNKVTGNEISLTLNSVDSGNGEESYVLNAEMKKQPGYNSPGRSTSNFLRSFEFSGTGYPVKMFKDYEDWQSSYNTEDKFSIIASRQDLAEAINALATDRESPLLKLISYSLRSKESLQNRLESPALADDSEGNGDIPF